MEMKVNPQKIKQLREAHGWSQEHLAEVAGLSGRTVQRIEAEGNASPESRMAVAAALGVEAAALGMEPAPAAVPAETGRPLTAQRKDRGWRHHVVVFLLVCGGLLLFDVVQHGGVTWSKWPLLGWGLGLLLHGLRRHDWSGSVTGR